MDRLKEKTARGLFWGGISNSVQQLLGLLFGIFLARILSVDDYGIIGMLAIFTGIAASLQEGGFISALTNRKEIKHEDYNAVFWFNVVAGCLLYLILFLSAPLIARFYNKPEMVWVSRIVFLGILFGCFGTAQSAYLFRNLKVKERAKIDMISLLVSSSISLLLALLGMAYWGLAIQLALHMAAGTFLRWFYSDWRPDFTFNIQPLKEMLPFSIKMLITNLFGQISANIFSVLLGKSYSATEVGYFTQGNKWMNMAKSVTAGMITGVAQPVFAQAAEEQERRTQILRKLIRFTAFVSFPSMFGLALISREFIVITITEKWVMSVPILQLLCIWGAFIPISEIYKNLVISSGNPDAYLKVNVIFGITQMGLLLLVIPYGVIWMTAVYVAAYFIYLVIWHFLSARIIPLRVTDVVRDMLPYLLVTGMALTAGWWAASFYENMYLRLLIKIAVSSVIYLLIIWRTGSVIFRESINFIRNL